MSEPSDPQDSLRADYASKSLGYFQNARTEMLDLVPLSCRTVLDVGCGSGVFGKCLQKRQSCEVWGVEPEPKCLPEAAENLHKVLPGYFQTGLPLPARYFDCIVFNDVLEHMLDPAAALEFAMTLLSEQGVIVASIPNIGHFPILWKLAVRGEWTYRPGGILDKTHLRFFTRSSIKDLFAQAGMAIETLQGFNDFYNIEPEDAQLWPHYRWISWIRLPAVQDMRHLQFAVVARRK